MSDLIIRDYVSASLAAILPAGYRIEKYQRIPDVIVNPTAILRQSRIGRAIANGSVIPGGRIAELTLTLAVPFNDIGAAEDRLDDEVVTLLDAIDAVANLRWTTAEKRVLSETTQAPCYDITLELAYQHTKE